MLFVTGFFDLAYFQGKTVLLGYPASDEGPQKVCMDSISCEQCMMNPVLGSSSNYFIDSCFQILKEPLDHLGSIYRYKQTDMKAPHTRYEAGLW